MSNRTKKAKHSSFAGKNNGPHITKITAGSNRNQAEAKVETAPKPAKDSPKPELMVSETGKTEVVAVDKADAELNKPKKLTRKERKALKSTEGERPLKSYFLLFRPFVALGRYIRDSWRELRQVRWPNRKATWKMTGAVLVYCALFMAFLLLLDVFFTWIFDLLFK